MPTFDIADDLPTTVQEREDRDEVGLRLFKRMLLDLQNQKELSTRSIELRASGLPFCPIKKFLLDENYESYSKDHYTETGTGIHKTLQRWLPRGIGAKHVFGNWKCTGCGRLKKMCLMPERCRCGGRWGYEEVELRYKKLTAHVDLILQLNFTPPLDYIVVDFKSTDMERKRSKGSWDQTAPSSRNYVVQIRTYCSLLTLQHKLNIGGWILPSINRAAPIRNELDFHPLTGDWDKARSKRWMKYLDAANEDFTILQRLLRHLKDNNPEEANDWLKEMVRSRPCQSDEDYRKWMHYAFYGKDVCAMKKQCCHGSHRDVLGEIRHRLRAKQ